jgi:hypothetical protein
VRDLFVAADAEDWGRADSAGNVLEERGHIHPGTDDLLDLCACHKLKNGGDVYTVDLASMPGGVGAGPVAARLRSRS